MNIFYALSELSAMYLSELVDVLVQIALEVLTGILTL